MASIKTLNSNYQLKESDFIGLRRNDLSSSPNCSSEFHIRFIVSHDFAELTLVGKYVALSPDDIVMVSSAQPINIINRGAPVKLSVFSERLHAPTPLNLVVVGDNPMVHDLMNAGERTLRFIVYRQLRNQITQRYFDLLTELERQDLQDVFIDYQREMTVGLLMTELLRHHEERISITDSYFPGKNIRHVNADTQSGMIFTYLVAHNADATLKETACYFGYDKNYFSRLCRRLFNKSFSEQLTFIRIELAKRMLAFSNKRIEQIAAELGYKNNSSFFTAFKREVAITPNDYREQHGYRLAHQHINDN
ncbi:helix-turn-helix transcriptional regulator [Lactiplantibacillus plantarum]|nr:helix-turn-helix transcriptional regulator [Lactiplantibacillus plantarum]